MAQLQPIDNISFEDALGELEGIVRSLESGKASLDDSIRQYERGIALKNHCETKLKQAQLKIEKITLSPDGTPRAEAFDPEQ